VPPNLSFQPTAKKWAAPERHDVGRQSREQHHGKQFFHFFLACWNVSYGASKYAGESYAKAAAAVIFFASRQADWVTGQVLYVGGGNRM